MKNILWTLFVVLSFLSVKSFSYEPVEGKITATFGPYFSKTNFSNNISGINSAYLSGVGLIALGDFNNKSSLEISFFYMPQKFFHTQGDLLLAEKTDVMHISMGYRRWLNPYFSTSLAFYSSYSMGIPQVIYNNLPKSSEIETSARDITEYGVDGALQGDLWSRDNFTLVLESRYSLSFTSKENEKSDQYGFFLGFRYIIQDEKKVEERPR